MEKFTIEKIEGRWTVNGKQFNELSPNEVIALDNFIKDYGLAGNESFFVKCISVPDENYVAREVIVGKNYELTSFDDEHYYLKDESGKNRYYEKQFFKKP